MTSLTDLLGDSAPMRALRKDVARVLAVTKGARRVPPILVQGETGTGKGLVAQLLHRAGARRDGPFISLNCAAIPESLLEAELFGYEPGAFTDAKRRKSGLFQAASGGVLFLDEVGLLSEGLQAKLLTAIEERRVRRLGATAHETIDVWVIAATNIDLTEAVSRKKFREDLYHRLAVIALRLPPLRERGSDVLALARHFLSRVCADYGLPPRHLLPESEARLLAYSWPGNVRELMNVIERASLMSADTAIDPTVLGLAEPAGRPEPAPRPRTDTMRAELLAALEETGWNITRAAAKLGLSRNTIRARVERFGLRPGTSDVATPAAIARTPAAASVPAAAARPQPSGRLVEWERRRVVFLRAALRADDYELLTVAQGMESIVEKVLNFGGRVEAIRQDSIDASFGAIPVDDASRRAVNAALTIQRSLGRERDQGSAAFASVIVLHTAQVLVARVGVGVQINDREKYQAALALDQLTGSAPSETILVGAELVPFIDRHFELAPEPRDDRSPGHVYRVVRPDPGGVGAWRRLSPFVDRDHELGVLEQCWDDARLGRGQLVGIVGEPGVGKSRLIWEFTRHHAALHRVVKAAATPARTEAPYLAVSELVATLLALPGGDDASQPDRIASRLEGLGMGRSQVAPILALLGHAPDPDWLRRDPVQRRAQIAASVSRLLAEVSARSPLIVGIEDAHWLDPESQGVLETVVEDLAARSLLLVIASRPEYAVPGRGRPYSTELRLDSLPDEQARALLDALIGNDESVATLKPMLATWTAGNPLFLEEGVRTLAEAGALQGETATYRLARQVSRFDVPPTVEKVLAERIDRLAPADKLLLQSMAVVGDEAEVTVLAELVEAGRQALPPSLGRLHAADFIYQSQTAPDRTFAFKHALTREVAYQMLTPERRRELHATVLAVGERVYADQLDVKADWLALHALRGEAWRQAVTYSQRAAARATARASNRLAAQHLESALAALDRLAPSDERGLLAIDLRIDLRHALTPLGQVQRTLEHLRRAEALAIQLDDPQRLGRVVSFMTNCLVLQGRYGEALVAGKRALAIAEELEDLPLRLATQMYVARARLNRGECQVAVELLREITRLLDERSVDDFLGLPVLPAAFARSHLVVGLAELGDFAQAEAHAAEAARRADLSGQPDSVFWAYHAIGLLRLIRGRADEAAGVFDRLLALCRTHDLDAYVSRTLTGLGLAKARLGGFEEGLSLLERAVSLDASAEPRTTYTLALTALAEAYFLSGRLDHALDTARHALRLARAHEERGVEAYAQWIAAETRSSRAGGLEQAEDSFHAAAAIATELNLRPLLAHCCLGLGDLYERRGDRDRAAEQRRHGNELLSALEIQPWILRSLSG